jgi:predicted acyltransferase
MQTNDNEPNAAASSQRILSVDVLRGFDMFWLVGANPLAISLLEFLGPTGEKGIRQLRHVAWEGFTFRDLVFPLFVFLVGMSTVFSLGRLLAQNGKAAAYRRLLRRAAMLYFLGWFVSGGFSNCWPNVRLLGVLHRIALCYLFTGILFIHCRLRGMIIACVALLTGYWALLSFVPVPGAGDDFLATRFAAGTNWANYIDSRFLPGVKIYGNGTWDPEGLLSTLPAIATCLLGVFAALLLKNPNVSERGKVGWLLGGGLLGVVLGYAWGLQFPIIKNIWTSSYVVLAGGYSCLLLGLFYGVIDVWKFQRWTLLFVWIGTNAITLYLIRPLANFDGLANRLVGGDVQAALGKPMSGLVFNAVSLLLSLILARFLYQHKIFLRV